MSNSNVEAYSKKYSQWAPAIAIAAILSIISIYAYNTWGRPLGGNEDFGTFGDYFGGTLNPILGFLTFIGLLITIWLQQETLKLQREELKASTEELAKSADALKIQNSTMLLQNFEGTFFRMLDRQSQLLDKIDHSNRNGMEAIEYLLRTFASRYAKSKNIPEAYAIVYATSGSTIGPYFRNLYHMIQFIDEAGILEPTTKRRYVNILRAQLTSHELALIFYNCLSGPGQGLYPLVVRYRLLKHIDPQFLVDKSWVNDPNYYPLETYQAS